VSLFGQLEIVVLVLIVIVVVVFVVVLVLIVVLAVLAILIVVCIVAVIVVVIVIVLIVVRHFILLQWVISYRSSMSKTHKNHTCFSRYFGTIFYCFSVTLVL